MDETFLSSRSKHGSQWKIQASIRVITKMLWSAGAIDGRAMGIFTHVLCGGWPHAQSLRFGGMDYGLWLLCGLNYSTAMSDQGIEPLILAVWARKELSVGHKHQRGGERRGVIMKVCVNFAFFAGGGGKALCVTFFPSSDLSFVDFNFMVDNSKPIFHSLFCFLSFSSEQKDDWCVFNQLMPKLLIEVFK